MEDTAQLIVSGIILLNVLFLIGFLFALLVRFIRGDRISETMEEVGVIFYVKHCTYLVDGTVLILAIMFFIKSIIFK